ncbi:Uncharacterized protein OS=Deinococcus gobiensis (strain DSM 21396 / JCM 16679 / CGMCC 1.7299 / I-0) GN=DGo_CA2227 PE=4 SV=1: DUF2721 [Gemmata massiliana]|uniref:DUF2721 domain-containing protein n=2 Tax=Gemmata massiliana TaxID=1210884 RepID=A0A6P2D2D5_9BACT|nr:Uncharacterized protein OS=Deinococcus gobiensis (strain DSM 21396 / JCM 16679 / CGMCC 1.7299 / I-0) GN=DGo_CA2227 PE=4 SV=1: DUF2721 [Gemmata massiliana]
MVIVAERRGESNDSRSAYYYEFHKGARMAITFLGAGDILGAMITPAVLISASGTLVLSTSNRLGRVVDRIRALATEAEGLPDVSAAPEIVEKRILIAEQIEFLTTRLLMLQSAVITLYMAIGLLVGASLAVGLSASAGRMMEWVPIGFGLLGASALLFGASVLVRESRLAVRGTLHELAHVRKVVERKTSMRAAPDEKPEGGQGEG